jgi:hypothetical protein
MQGQYYYAGFSGKVKDDISRREHGCQILSATCDTIKILDGRGNLDWRSIL